MFSPREIDLQKVAASLNTVCPQCMAVIEPSQIMRINFDEIKCPWCDAMFQPQKTA
jgi:hypothetical protein